MSRKDYQVRAGYCHHRASEEEIYKTLKRITDPLDRSWAKLEAADNKVVAFGPCQSAIDLHHI